MDIARVALLAPLLFLVGCLMPPSAVAPSAAFSSPATPGRRTPDEPVPPAAHAPRGRFYARRPFGSEAQFNPLSLIVNGGFDQLRTSDNRDITTFPYGASLRAVLHTVTNPATAVRRYGVENWLRHEVFPLSTKASGGGQWYPNYHLHLFAGGMTFARTAEWYALHGTPHPRLAAAATTTAWHLLTEITENGRTPYSVDALTDLLVFDPASMLLWSQSWMQRPFGERIEFTNWPGQPSFVPSSNRLENASMMAALRVPLPRTDVWKVMTTMGNAFLVGLSRALPGDRLWLSTAVGFDPADTPVVDSTTGAKTATLLPNAGVFIDRDGSLLVSAIAKGGGTDGLTINVYPLGRSAWWPGLWVQRVRGGGVRYGVVSRAGLGIGGLARRVGR